MHSQILYMHIIMNRTMQPPKTLRTDALQAIETCAGWNSRLAARRITQFLEKRMTGSGLTIAQFGLMAHIAAASDDTLGALAERLGLDQSSLSRNLHALEHDGLVEIAVVERDLRKRAVWLTEKGARRLEEAMPVWRSAHAALAEVLEPGLARKLAIASEALIGR
jgi:DNA-binding MarR family transcriptional regulator